jgi:hypothetical protein
MRLPSGDQAGELALPVDSLRGSDPSAFITHSLESWPVQQRYAIFEPSGDQYGNAIVSAFLVSGWGPPPSAPMR